MTVSKTCDSEHFLVFIKKSGDRTSTTISIFIKQLLVNFENRFDKSFTSPLSKTGVDVYNYVLSDSTFIDNKWCYNIIYYPRRKNELTFKGDFWVNDTTFAIKKINMQVTGEAELNVQGVLDLFITLVLADGFSAEKEPESFASAKSYARWFALKWIEGLLASGQVPAGVKRQALHRSWTGYLAAEENSGFWKDLPPPHRESCLKRLETLRPSKKIEEQE